MTAARPKAANDNHPPAYTSAELALPSFRVDINETAFSGVYFLMNGDEVIYIGQSASVLARVLWHKTNGVDFDAYTYVQCDLCDLDRMEAAYTVLHRPRMNFKPCGAVKSPAMSVQMEQILIDGRRVYERQDGTYFRTKAA